MTEQQTFTCGHRAELKPGMFGRGQARKERIARYFSRPCLPCALESARAQVQSYTDPKGHPLPVAILNQKLTQRSARLKLSYALSVQ